MMKPKHDSGRMGRAFYSLVLAGCLAVFPQVLLAANTSKTVSQVTSSVTLSEDVDYHISGTTPFATTGSIDITNTEHAVVIFDAVKPSNAASLLGYITINGEKAADGTNCQLKMHGSKGSIVLPYGNDVKMLTCYTEKGLQGESCDDYTTGSSSGYMISLSAAKLNNRIRSFRLKRGYMVTFAVGSSGYGYSRCFIAQDEDLEVDLPDILDQRISSYRIFKWQDTGKNGVCNGNQTTADEMNEALNTSWSFSWYWSGIGNSQLPDRDYVVHQYKEYTPHTNNLGEQEWTCHMKTNNEPANSSDEGACTVADVLANWEEKMRTGLRLCSPSQHDGGLSWTQQFFDSIDARGWRCDIFDIHCYWPEWNLNNQLSGYYSKYSRPIWVSEFIWGASWNSNGVFASSDPDNDNYTVMSKVLNNWNAADYVERYAYWNSESKGHIYENGKLTKLGEFYAAMNTGLAYKADKEYVPTNWRITSSYDLTATYTASKSTCLLKWYDDNFDLLDRIVVQRKSGTDGAWEEIATVQAKDTKGVAYQYQDTLYETGLYTYRILTQSYSGRNYLSGEASVTKGGTVGSGTFQYGSIDIADISASVNVEFTQKYESKPLVFTGLLSNNNSSTLSTPFFNTSAISTSKFDYIGLPWQNQPDGATTYSTPEQLPFLVIPEGNYTWGDMTAEAGLVPLKDTTRVSFQTPFPEGVTPVVIATVNRATNKTQAIMHKIWNVDNTGFTANVMYEQALSASVAVNQQLAYLAVTPGVGLVDESTGITVAAGHSDVNLYALARQIYFTDETGADTFQLESPLIFGELYTANTPVPAILRKASEITKTVTDEDGETHSYVVGARVRRYVDKSLTSSGVDTRTTADNMSWLAIYTPSDYVPSAISSPAVSSQGTQLAVHVSPNRTITVEGHSDFQLYTLGGASVDTSSPLAPGIYFVRAGLMTQKVIVR